MSVVEGLIQVKRNNVNVPLVSTACLQRLVELFHTSSHMGRDKVISAMSAYYCHPAINKVVATVVKECKICQVHKGKPVGGEPMYRRGPNSLLEEVDINLLELSPGTGGIKYLLVGVDVCSRFLYAVPIRNKRSDTVVAAIEQRILPTMMKLPKMHPD